MRAAVYARLSSDPEGRALGVERQEQDARALAERRGWDVVGVYTDNDISASGRKRRPGWERLLDDIEAGQLDALVAYSSSRLYRNLRDLTRLLDAAEARGLSIATVASGDVDVTTADGRMLARILASVDAAEWERVSERVSRSHRQAAERGARHGRLGFGYDSEGRVVEAEAAVIRDAAERVLNGETLASVAAGLNARGVTTQAGSRWDAGHLRRVLTAPRMAGLRKHRDELHPAEWEPILDRRTWQDLVDLSAGRSTGPSAGRYLLTGLVHCGVCGARLVGHPLTDGRTYACVSSKGGCGKIRVRAARVEGYVTLRAMSARVEAVRLVAEPDEELRALQAEAVELEEHIAEANRSRIAEAWSPTLYAATVKPWRRRLDEIEQAIASRQQVPPSQPAEPLDPTLAAPLFAWVDGSLPFEDLFSVEEWDALLASDRTRAGVRATIERRVERVDVRPSAPGGRWRSIADRVDIAWREGVQPPS